MRQLLRRFSQPHRQGSLGLLRHRRGCLWGCCSRVRGASHAAIRAENNTILGTSTFLAWIGDRILDVDLRRGGSTKLRGTLRASARRPLGVGSSFSEAAARAFLSPTPNLKSLSVPSYDSKHASLSYHTPIWVWLPPFYYPANLERCRREERRSCLWLTAADARHEIGVGP